ncbi:MAG: ABC transporter permease [Candidatus Thermoplasmatota archaeon]|jgi:ABC-type transport system involved in multi-copper enzyme maturation permease subunit
MHVRAIARHELIALTRERTAILLFAILFAMTIAAAYIGWSSHHIIQQVYDASAEMLRAQGRPVPSPPSTDTSSLSILQNLVVYLVLIGALLAISLGHAVGMRERRAGMIRILFSRPVTKADYLLGKSLGLLFVLSLAMLVVVGVSLASVALFATPTLVDIGALLILVGVSLVYLLGFALAGLAAGLVVDDDAVALLVPVILWLTLTFALPEFASSIHPTASLNPVASTNPSDGGTLRMLGNLVGPFSITEHYKEACNALLNAQTTPGGIFGALRPQAFNLASLVVWLAACFAACGLAAKRLQPASGDLHA